MVGFPWRSCVWSNRWCYLEIRGIARPNGLYALPPLGVVSSMLCECVPTVVKLRGRVIKGSAFLWGYVLLIPRIFFTTYMTDIKEQRICIKFCFNLKLLKKPTECYRKPSDIMPWAKAKRFYVQLLQGRTNVCRRRRPFWTTVDRHNTGKIRKVREDILAERRQTTHDVFQIGLSYGTVQRILADNLNMRHFFKICAKAAERRPEGHHTCLRICRCMGGMRGRGLWWSKGIGAGKERRDKCC